MTKWKSLASEADYNAAVDRVNDLMDVKRTDALHNELNLLSFLIEDYEGRFHSLPDASPLEVIRFAMEMKGIKQQDLIPVLGTKGNVSKILSGKASIQLNDIHPLSLLLGIPMDSLIPKEEIYTKSHEYIVGYVAEPEKQTPKSIQKKSEPVKPKSYGQVLHSKMRAAPIKKGRKKSNT